MKIELTLYADVLFLIDFSMDFVSLYITGRMTHVRAKAWRMILAAALGALCSVLLTCFEAGRVISVLTGILCAFLMCFAAFGAENMIDYIRRCAVLWCAGFVLGGTMTAAVSMGNYGSSYREGAAAHGKMLLILPAAFVASVLFFVIGHVSSRKSVSVKIIYHGRESTLRGLSDSGNLLTDPFSGDMVIIISKSSAERVLGDNQIMNFTAEASNEFFTSRIRLIPVTGIGGESLLKAVRVDSVYINGKERRALVAISDTASDFAGSFECLVPSKLI